jgi:hypothetical protein
VLKIVQQDQRWSVAQEGGQVLAQRAAIHRLHSHRASDQRKNQRRVADWREFHDVDVSGEYVLQVSHCSHCSQRELRLSDATWSGQRQHTYVVTCEQFMHQRQLVLASDEWCQGHRQRRGTVGGVLADLHSQAL